MKKTALFFLILFLGFIISPSLITYIDKTADISLAFTANEEETSAKNQVVFECFIHTENKQDMGMCFLLSQSSLEHYYNKKAGLVFLEIHSPPPRNI
ncbi:hypothetical protein BH23BAC2_BH23BAC2_02350 [soil metagenome]